MTFALGFIIFHWYFSLFCQSFYLHRYVSHGMYQLTPFWSRFFCLLTIASQGPSFLKPSAYKRLHCRHHLHSDEEQDPHSPMHSRHVLDMMLRTFREYLRPSSEKEEFPKMVRFFDSIPVRLSFVVLYALLYLSFTDSLWFLILVPVHSLMGPIHGAIVNWCGHKYGYRNHEVPDNSRNTLLIDFLMMGELYQNNHHFRPHHSNFSHQKYEIDLTYHLVRLLQRVGIVT